METVIDNMIMLFLSVSLIFGVLILAPIVFNVITFLLALPVGLVHMIYDAIRMQERTRFDR